MRKLTHSKNVNITLEQQGQEATDKMFGKKNASKPQILFNMD